MLSENYPREKSAILRARALLAKADNFLHIPRASILDTSWGSIIRRRTVTNIDNTIPKNVADG